MKRQEEKKLIMELENKFYDCSIRRKAALGLGVTLETFPKIILNDIKKFRSKCTDMSETAFDEMIWSSIGYYIIKNHRYAIILAKTHAYRLNEKYFNPLINSQLERSLYSVINYKLLPKKRVSLYHYLFESEHYDKPKLMELSFDILE